MEKDLTSISIPSSLYQKIEEKIKDSDIESVSSYVTDVLEKSLPEDQKTEDAFSEEDEEKVKERLKALGYLD